VNKHAEHLMLTREAIAVLKQLPVVDFRVAQLEKINNQMEELRLQIASGNVGFEVQQRCVRCATELLRLRQTLVSDGLLTEAKEQSK
jgi:hypothetical protein